MTAVATIKLKDGSEHKFPQAFDLEWQEGTSATGQAANTRARNNFETLVTDLFSPGTVFSRRYERDADAQTEQYKAVGGEDIVGGRAVNAYIGTDDQGAYRFIPAEEIAGVTLTDAPAPAAPATA